MIWFLVDVRCSTHHQRLLKMHPDTWSGLLFTVQMTQTSLYSISCLKSFFIVSGLLLLMEVSFCGSQVFYAKEVLADLYKDLKGLRFVISCTLTKKWSLSQAPQLIKGQGKKRKKPIWWNLVRNSAYIENCLYGQILERYMLSAVPSI
jgi:hypothetical protein